MAKSGKTAPASPSSVNGAAEHDESGAGVRWRPVTRSRAYEQVIDRVEEQITSGAVRVGDRLPAERDLASMLGVSRAAVREALRVLEAQGVVRAGVGADGGTVITSLSSQALTQMLRLHIALANFPMPDVIEARVMLERWSARLAALDGAEDALAELDRLVAEMPDATDDRERFNRLDTAFHVGIAQAGRNRLVADMTTAIRDSMHNPILFAFQRVENWDELSAELIAQHANILKEIRNGAQSEAADAVEAHIRYAYQALGWTAA